MKRKLLDVILFLLAGFFLLVGVKNFFNKYNFESPRCKKVTDSFSEVALARLKPYPLYEKVIVGKLLPADQTNKTQDLPPKDLNLYLMGTAIIGEQKSAIFYFKKERRCLPYKVGEEVDGWKIADILQGKVILEAGEQNTTLTITDAKVVCSKVRSTPGQMPEPTVFLDTPTKLSFPPKAATNKKQNPTQNQKASKGTLRKNQPSQKTKIIRPTSKNAIKTNPFLELLKKMKNKGGPENKPKGTNPFLEMIRRNQQRKK